MSATQPSPVRYRFPRVRVGVEDADHQDLVEDAAEHGPCQLDPLIAVERRRRVGQRDAVDPVHHQHARAGEVGDRSWDAEASMSVHCRGDEPEVAGLRLEVELSEHAVREALRGLQQSQLEGPLGPALEPRRQPQQDVEVSAHLSGDVGPLDLDGHPSPVVEGRSVHLCDGGGRDGLVVEGGEARVDLAEVLADHPADDVGGEGVDLLLEEPQFRGDLGGDEIPVGSRGTGRA